MKYFIQCISLTIFLSCCNLSYKLGKTEWTIPEVKQWSESNKINSTWKGVILYQGSDSIHHHYIGRVMDEWVWFNIKRTELKIESSNGGEKPYNKASKGQFGYYYVDPTQEFLKVGDYTGRK